MFRLNFDETKKTFSGVEAKLLSLHNATWRGDAKQLRLGKHLTNKIVDCSVRNCEKESGPGSSAKDLSFEKVIVFKVNITGERFIW